MVQKRGIGFIPSPASKTDIAAIHVVVRDVDAEFKSMLLELSVEEESHRKLLALDETIRKELAKIYKKIQKLEKIVQEWNSIRRRIEVLARENPQSALSQIPRLDEMAREIVGKGKKLFDEINKHIQMDVSPLYQEIELSKQEVKQIRELAYTLNNHLGELVNPVERVMRNQELAMMERSIRLQNPRL